MNGQGIQKWKGLGSHGAWDRFALASRPKSPAPVEVYFQSGNRFDSCRCFGIYLCLLCSKKWKGLGSHGAWDRFALSSEYLGQRGDPGGSYSFQIPSFHSCAKGRPGCAIPLASRPPPPRFLLSPSNATASLLAVKYYDLTPCHSPSPTLRAPAGTPPFPEDHMPSSACHRRQRLSGHLSARPPAHISASPS